MFCWKCGKYLNDEAKYCISCGESVGENYRQRCTRESHTPNWPWNGDIGRSSSTVQTVSAVSATEKQRNIVVSIVAAVVALIVIFFAVHWYRSMALGRVMNACENRVDAETWDLLVDGEYPVYRLADHGRTLIVDGASPSSDILTCIVKESRMPESVLNRINGTRALDGTLNDSWDNITVSWNYHPGVGVNMVFEVK